ncbi:MAG: phosphoenolpyruvate synthase, partial [candidate division Zixibacteria bacterium]|nr:phosphoenolpyruvate synthase [candidate division Zixibacteria bacterium]
MGNLNNYVKKFDELNSDNVAEVGGKNASLGEMLSNLKKSGINVPGGFATTAAAYREFIDYNEIEDKLTGYLKGISENNSRLEKNGKKIRRLFTNGRLPGEFKSALKTAYEQLCNLYEDDEVDTAVRSSATAEDLPDASFAGQQETFLNVTGVDELFEACKKCFASLFTDRAITYREEKGFDHMKVALSVGVQKMVRSDKAGSGVMFSIDTETGFPDVIVINAAWGLGENVVQGSVNPDEYMVFKPLLGKSGIVPIIERKTGKKEKKMVYSKGGSHKTKNVDTLKKEQKARVLNDEEILQLALWAKEIENHYGKPMDIEWAKDGNDEQLYIVQARPETVQSQKETSVMKNYSLREQGKEIIRGLSIGEAIAAGKASVLTNIDEIDRFEEDTILVTGQTDPDWVPIMKKASGIVTDYGGRTSHAAIVSRELGLP